MSTSRTTNSATSSVVESAQEKPGFRTKTIATRITPEELREVEAAAERSGKTLAEWLRELSLKAARERPADPTELVLSELAALRYMLLNLFHATAQANAESKYLLAESVLKIRDQANARKQADARKLLADFLAGEVGGVPARCGFPAEADGFSGWFCCSCWGRLWSSFQVRFGWAGR